MDKEEFSKRAEEAKERATRIMDMRNRIVESLPDDAVVMEAIMAGLTVFYQATLDMTDDDQEHTDKILSDCMFLARQMYEADNNECTSLH